MHAPFAHHRDRLAGMSSACHREPLFTECEWTCETAFVGIFACMCTASRIERCTRGYYKTVSTQHLPVSI